MKSVSVTSLQSVTCVSLETSSSPVPRLFLSSWSSMVPFPTGQSCWESRPPQGCLLPSCDTGGYCCCCCCSVPQSCLTLSDPIDCSTPGFPLLHWVKNWKVKSLSHVWLFATPWTVAHQAPLSMEFSRQEYWSRLTISYCRGSSQPTDWNCISCIGRGILYHWAATET